MTDHAARKPGSGIRTIRRVAPYLWPEGQGWVKRRVVLALLAEGLRNADIAQRLHRSVRTVDHQVAAVLAKLGTGSRAEAVDRARREGWLGPDPATGAAAT
jgi:DNA-binding CsgD family transcriptional regulator